MVSSTCGGRNGMLSIPRRSFFCHNRITNFRVASVAASTQFWFCSTTLTFPPRMHCSMLSCSEMDLRVLRALWHLSSILLVCVVLQRLVLHGSLQGGVGSRWVEGSFLEATAFAGEEGEEGDEDDREEAVGPVERFGEGGEESEEIRCTLFRLH